MTTKLDFTKDLEPQLKDLQYSKLYRPRTTIIYYENGWVLYYRFAPVAMFLINGQDRQRYIFEPYWGLYTEIMQNITEFFNLDDISQLLRYVRDKRIEKAQAYDYELRED